MKRSCVAAGVAAALFATAAAGEVEYGVEAGIGTSDNIGRTPDDGESSTILTTGFDVRWLREEGFLTADVDVDLSYFHYDDSSYDSEITGLAEADLRLRFMPDRFEWVISDTFGQVQSDPFVASTPNTRENVNFFSTGPDVTFRLGSVAAVTMFGRYSMSTYETSAFDDERTLGGLSIGRDLSQRSNFSFNATSERVEFTDAPVEDGFDRQSYYLAYEVDGMRTSLSAQGGYSEVHDGGDTQTYPLVSLNVARDISPRSVLSLTAGARSSDTASALGADDVFGGGGPALPGRIATTDTFEMRDARVAWDFRAPRTTFGVSAGYSEDIYDTATEFDRNRQALNLTARRQLTPRFSIVGEAHAYRTDFEQTDQEDDELQFGLTLSWNPTGRLFIDLEANHFDRDSTVVDTEFSENRFFLRFAWRSTGERAD